MALGRNPTRQTDRSDLLYGLDQSPYQLPAISPNDCLLTQEKLSTLPKPEYDFPQLYTASSKTTGFLRGKRGNLSLTGEMRYLFIY